MLEFLVLAGLILLLVIVQLLARLSNDIRTLTVVLSAQARAQPKVARDLVPAPVPPPPPLEPADLGPPSSRGRCHRCSEEIPSYVAECPHCGAPRPIRSTFPSA